MRDRGGARKGFTDTATPEPTSVERAERRSIGRAAHSAAPRGAGIIAAFVFSAAFAFESTRARTEIDMGESQRRGRPLVGPKNTSSTMVPTMPKAKSKQVEEIPVELEPDILARIDALKEHFSTEDHKATRDDVLRALTIYGLKAKEREAKEQKAERSSPRKVNP